LITLGCFTFLMVRFVNWKPKRKQTLESLLAVSVAGLTPGILGSSSPTKLEKNHLKFEQRDSFPLFVFLNGKETK
jgi:hypothetical protein